MKPIYRSSGTYLGFIMNNILYSRDGEYLGWLDGHFVWDRLGTFRGQLIDDKYIWINRFQIQPVPKQPIAVPSIKPALPNSPNVINAVSPPTGWADAF